MRLGVGWDAVLGATEMGVNVTKVKVHVEEEGEEEGVGGASVELGLTAAAAGGCC